MSLTARDYTLLLGLPGTGKTTALSLLVRALMARQEKVCVVCACVQSVCVYSMCASLGKTPSDICYPPHPSRC